MILGLFAHEVRKVGLVQALYIVVGASLAYSCHMFCSHVVWGVYCSQEPVVLFRLWLA